MNKQLLLQLRGLTKMKKLLLCFAIFSVAMASHASAALPSHSIFEPVGAIDHGVYSLHQDPLSTPDPDAAKAYDNFSLSSAYIINGINWSGIYAEPIPSPGANVDFLIEIWGDDNSSPDLSNQKASYFLTHGPAAGPAALPNPNGDVTRSSVSTGDHVSPLTSTSAGGGPAVEYSSSLPATLLGAGDYWISIQAVQLFNSPLAVDPEWQWHIGESASPDGFFSADLTLNPGAGIKGELIQQDKDLAFTLRGMVPEPSGIALAFMGLASLGFTRRKRA
jgi:hypothetical protein